MSCCRVVVISVSMISPCGRIAVLISGVVKIVFPVKVEIIISRVSPCPWGGRERGGGESRQGGGRGREDRGGRGGGDKRGGRRGSSGGSGGGERGGGRGKRRGWGRVRERGREVREGRKRGRGRKAVRSNRSRDLTRRNPV